jgi:hypothetical protein
MRTQSQRQSDATTPEIVSNRQAHHQHTRAEQLTRADDRENPARAHQHLQLGPINSSGFIAIAGRRTGGALREIRR